MPSNGPTSTFPRRRISRSTIIEQENHAIRRRSTIVMPTAILYLVGIVFCDMDGRSGGAAEHGAAGIAGRFAEALLDADQLVVFGEAIGAGQRAGLDLSAIGRHREVGD